VNFKEAGIYYTVGEIITDKWQLIISVVAVQVRSILDIVVPKLEKDGVPFKIIRNRQTHYKLNNGELGIQHVGKVIRVFANGHAEYERLKEWLTAATSGFRGPIAGNNPRLAGIIYSGKSRKSSLSKVPIMGPWLERRKKRQLVFRSKRVIGGRYRPLTKLRFSVKGEIHKGIDTRGLRYCVIKRGRFCAFEDDHGRTIRDRLKWQSYLAERIGMSLPVQRILDYIEDGEDTYLVLEYLEGKNFGQVVREFNPKALPWKEVGIEKRLRLLIIFQDLLRVIAKVHDVGIVHRDITEGNFILVPGKGVHVIDFELAYDVHNQLPVPPFYPGAVAFRAPEQNEQPIESYKEDIFSLGCLLAFMVTQWLPKSFSKEAASEVEAKVWASTGDEIVTSLVLKSTDSDPKGRPDMMRFIAGIQEAIDRIILWKK
jgi:Protein kinase domain